MEQLHLNLVFGGWAILRARVSPLLFGVVALGACAIAPPSGPTVIALPPEGKNLVQFQQEDVTCREHAQKQVVYGVSQQTVNQSAIGTAAAGTALGAATGAAVGTAAGAAGTGAVVGATTGLLAGSSLAANNAAASAVVLQQNYDVAYAQCMAASGNQVQPFSLALVGAPYDYVEPDSDFYDPWFAPAIGFAFVEPRFHHEHHEFHDDHEGQHEFTGHGFHEEHREFIGHGLHPEHRESAGHGFHRF